MHIHIHAHTHTHTQRSVVELLVTGSVVQTDSTFSADWMPFVSPKQQRQSTEEKFIAVYYYYSGPKLIVIPPDSVDLVALMWQPYKNCRHIWHLNNAVTLPRRIWWWRLGAVTVVEFPTTSMEMQAVADKFDRDGDGFIDYKEFITALRPERGEVAVTVYLVEMRTCRCHGSCLFT